MYIYENERSKLMSISVKELMSLPFFQFLQLETKNSGLQNKIETIGILEYEYETGTTPKRKFEVNSIVLTSLYFAKNNPTILIETLRMLYRDGVSGLIIKKIFFEELPEEFLEYAEELCFPIFTYDKKEPLHFEDILLTLKQVISFEENQQLIEKQLTDYLYEQQSFTETELRQLFMKNQPVKSYQIFYLLPKTTQVTYAHWLNLFKNFRQVNTFLQGVKYKQGIFLIVGQTVKQAQQPLPTLGQIFHKIGISADIFQIGCGSSFTLLSALKQALNEALVSAKYSQLFQQSVTNYSQLGVYQLLLPFFEEPVFIEYSQQLLSKIRTADSSKKQKLLETARVFVQEEGDIKRMADTLEIHENSVRYRLQKIMNIVNQQPSYTLFSLYEQLSVAFKIEELRLKKEL